MKLSQWMKESLGKTQVREIRVMAYELTVARVTAYNPECEGSGIDVLPG